MKMSPQDQVDEMDVDEGSEDEETSADMKKIQSLLKTSQVRYNFYCSLFATGTNN